MKDDSHIDKGDGTFRSLYLLGGIAALMVAALTLGEIIFFVFFPPPETIYDWFLLFQSNALIGLLDFWGLEIPMYLMFILVFLALYMQLRKTNHGLMVIALSCAMLGVAIFLATNNPFSMLTLSKLHADATTEAQQSALLAAGQTILANTNQRAVGGFNIALLLVSVAGLITSLVMLQDHFFSRSSATIGILAFSLSLADYLRQTLTQSLIISLPVILFGALFLVIWFVLIGLKLYQLGRDDLN
ncbi:MAG: DUF4386 family protein [Anaerolineales bacterium]